MSSNRLTKAALYFGVFGIFAEVASLQPGRLHGITGAILIAAGIIATAITKARTPTAP